MHFGSVTEDLKVTARWGIHINSYLCGIVQSLGKTQSWLKFLTAVIDTGKLFLCHSCITFFPPSLSKTTRHKNTGTQNETGNFFLGKFTFSTTKREQKDMPPTFWHSPTNKIQCVGKISRLQKLNALLCVSGCLYHFVYISSFMKALLNSKTCR